MAEYNRKEGLLDDDREPQPGPSQPSGREHSLEALEPIAAPKVNKQETGEESRARIPSTGPRSSGMAGSSVAAKSAQQEEATALFAPSEANELRSRWDTIQVGFVDEPRSAVKEADELVALTMKRLGEVFTEERRRLEHQWGRGEDTSTEDLRLALRRYRSFFSRLLTF